MNIISGKIMTAQKVVLYGPEGIGKSTFAARFPDPLFIDTEGSTKHIDVRRFDKPTSWTMLLEQVKYVRDNIEMCKTLVVDTFDWAEKLAYSYVCSSHNWSSMETPGYGTGYRYAYEEMGRLLNLLSEVIDVGIHVVVLAHAAVRKFEQPDEMGAYDRWELKLQNSPKCNTAAMLKEWADMVLFASYRTIVVKDGTGEHAKSKAQGGKRVMYTSHHPCWDAKNRHGLPEQMDFDFAGIAHCFPSAASIVEQPVSDKTPSDKVVNDTSANESSLVIPENIPVALKDLMKNSGISEEIIRYVVAEKGYFPYETPIVNYGADFINGALIAGWNQLLPLLVRAMDSDIPF